MTLYPLGKKFRAYEVHPVKSGVEIIVAPAEIGTIEQRKGVEAILSNGYRLIHHSHSTMLTEVRRLSSGDRELFMRCYEDNEIFPWLEDLKVRNLKVVN